MRINEYNLAKEFGVSRSPVREAVRMLERDGLLVPCSNGTMVNPLEGEAICEIYQARLVLESLCCPRQRRTHGRSRPKRAGAVYSALQTGA